MVQEALRRGEPNWQGEHIKRTSRASAHSVAMEALAGFSCRSSRQVDLGVFECGQDF